MTETNKCWISLSLARRLALVLVLSPILGVSPLYLKWFVLVNGGSEAYHFIDEETGFESFEPYSYDVIADLIDDSEE